MRVVGLSLVIAAACLALGCGGDRPALVDPTAPALGGVDRDFRLEEVRLQSTVSLLDSAAADPAKQMRSFAEFSPNDGEVVRSDAFGYPWIDLGRRHGLRYDTRLQVYQVAEGGLQRIKGVIEVHWIGEDRSRCVMIENAEVIHPITGERLVVPDVDDPIAEGDLIRNPFFDADQQPTFVFLGTKLENGYYSLRELQRKVEEFGGKVDRDVSIGTDFVVVLGCAEDDADLQERIRRATQFGVIFMREEELLEYLPR